MVNKGILIKIEKIKMGSPLGTFEEPISGMKILNPENYEKASVIFNDFELVKYNSLEGITFDGSVVDAPREQVIIL